MVTLPRSHDIAEIGVSALTTFHLCGVRFRGLGGAVELWQLHALKAGWCTRT